MRVVVVIQARVGSVRLPAKSLLPIGGIPVAVLAAKRAQWNAYDVRMATTVDPSDDILVEVAREAGIPVVRGSVQDVLGRFVEATADLPNETIVVRLTADNVFPDADFINLLVDSFRREKGTTLVTATPASNFPYGLTAEVFTCRMLREAAREAATPYQREHVTPWIKSRHGQKSIKVSEVPKKWGTLRCTIDTLDDYVRVWKVFKAHGGDPVSIPWKELCEVLARLSKAPSLRVPIREVRGVPHSILVLGTAQLGLNYGWANNAGCLSEEEAVHILKKAAECGITHLDTARAYGDSERRIGLALEKGYRSTVITKLDPLESLPPEASEYCVRKAVDASVFRSCRELKASRLDVLLLHRAAHLDSHHGVVWKRLCELRDEGVIGALGVSVQNVSEALRSLAAPDVKNIQIPFNILDRRWLDPTFQELLRVRSDVNVYARSPLLQGLLALKNPALWPLVPGIDPHRILSKLQVLVERLGRRDRVDLALAYVRGQKWIHGVVLGVEKIEQLIDAVKLTCTPALSPEECELIEQEMEPGLETLVNPALWPSKR